MYRLKIKIKLINIITIILIFNNSLCQNSQGECANVGYKAISFESCQGKVPYDSANYYCCFLKSGKIQKCVEVAKEDIDNNKVKTTIREIEKGIYEPWEDNSLNKIYNKLNSFECDKSQFLKFSQIVFLLLFFY